MEELPKVADMMDKVFTTLKPDMPICEAVDILMKKKMTGAIVVDDKNNLVGILSEKDCLRILLYDTFHDEPNSQVKHLMHTDPITVPSDQDIISTAQLFLNSTFRRLPVVDGGKLVGQITRRDILRGMREHNRLLKKCV